MARILIAEDQDLQRDLLVHQLQRQGHDVTPAHDGQELLDYLYISEAPFDMVITDNCMPVMSGIEALRCIKVGDEHRHLPIIVFSDTDDPKTIETINKLGGTFINKREPERLLEAVGKLP